MGGDTKRRISDLEIELTEERNKNKLLMTLLSDRPTLRDQFAMAALTGVITRSGTYFGIEEFDKFAAWSYEIADKMMEARKDG